MRDTGDRAVSEGLGVAVLVIVTLLVTASIGMGVLIGSEGEGSGDGIDSEFRFEQLDNRLVITYERGPTLTAGNLYLEGPQNEVTWAAIADIDESASVSAGDTQQLSPNNAYGSAVGSDTVIEVVHVSDNGTRSVLDSRGSATGG
jgi:hypothetical protein